MKTLFESITASGPCLAALCSCAGGSSGNSFCSDGQQLFIGDDIAVAPTQYGKVRGFILRGVYQFRGITTSLMPSGLTGPVKLLK